MTAINIYLVSIMYAQQSLTNSLIKLNYVERISDVLETAGGNLWNLS